MDNWMKVFIGISICHTICSTIAFYLIVEEKIKGNKYFGDTKEVLYQLADDVYEAFWKPVKIVFLTLSLIMIGRK